MCLILSTLEWLILEYCTILLHLVERHLIPVRSKLSNQKIIISQTNMIVIVSNIIWQLHNTWHINKVEYLGQCTSRCVNNNITKICEQRGICPHVMWIVSNDKGTRYFVPKCLKHQCEQKRNLILMASWGWGETLSMDIIYGSSLFFLNLFTLRSL